MRHEKCQTDGHRDSMKESAKGRFFEKTLYDDEPRVDVVARMLEFGFTDCWVETGRKGPLATCR